MKHATVPAIKNAETEAFCKASAKKYRAILKKYTEGSTELMRARMKLSEEMMEWMTKRDMVRWEQLAVSSRISDLARQ